MQVLMANVANPGHLLLTFQHLFHQQPNEHLHFHQYLYQLSFQSAFNTFLFYQDECLRASPTTFFVHKHVRASLYNEIMCTSKWKDRICVYGM